MIWLVVGMVACMGLGFLLSQVLQSHPAPPSLLDLEEWEADRLAEHDRGAPLRPVPPIPGMIGADWDENALKKMRQNRRVAEEINRRIEGRK